MGDEIKVDYSDIDRLESEQNRLLEEQQQVNNDLVDKQAEQQVTRVEKQKQDQQEEAIKQASGLYTNYKKQDQQFGVNQEQLIAQGLGKSGYAESNKVSLYNQYQANVTETMNTNNKLQADYNLQIDEIYQNADIQKAQILSELYTTKINNLLTNYQLRYQKYRDAVEDWKWSKEFDMQQQSFNQSQSNWEREYALSLEKSRSSSNAKKSSSSRSPALDLSAGNSSNNNNSTAPSTSSPKYVLEDVKDFNSINSRNRKK